MNKRIIISALVLSASIMFSSCGTIEEGGISMPDIKDTTSKSDNTESTAEKITDSSDAGDITSVSGETKVSETVTSAPENGDPASASTEAADENKSGTVSYHLELPENANGNFTISFAAYVDDGFKEIQRTDAFSCPQTTEITQNVTGEGENKKIYVMLRNEDTQTEGSVIGNYVFNFTDGTYYAEFEDAEKAFQDIMEGGNFQDEFKTASIREYQNMIDDIRTEITLNKGEETNLMIAKQAVSLINWSMGTTLNSDELRSEWNAYTANWEKSDFQAFSTLFGLVYDECSRIVDGTDNNLLEKIDFADSDYSYVELPLEPMEILKEMAGLT